MSAPRLLQRPTLHMNRSTILLLPRTAILHRRLFSQCYSLFQQNSPRDHEERLQAARPLVPHQAARKFTQAGSSRNSRLTVIATVLAAIGFYFYNSQTVPVTGRRRFNFLSDEMVARAHSKAAAQQIEMVRAAGKHFLSDWDPRTILVKRVMKRLIPVSGMTNLDWEIFVISDNRMLPRLR